MMPTHVMYNFGFGMNCGLFPNDKSADLVKVWTMGSGSKGGKQVDSLNKNNAVSHAWHSLGRGGQDGVVIVVLLLLVEDLQLQKELLLVEELCIGGVHLGRTLFVCLLVWWDVLVVLQLLHLHPGGQNVKWQHNSFILLNQLIPSVWDIHPALSRST